MYFYSRLRCSVNPFFNYFPDFEIWEKPFKTFNTLDVDDNDNVISCSFFNATDLNSPISGNNKKIGKKINSWISWNKVTSQFGGARLANTQTRQAKQSIPPSTTSQWISSIQLWRRKFGEGQVNRCKLKWLFLTYNGCQL